MSVNKYYNEIQKLIEKIIKTQHKNIIETSKLFAGKIEEGKIIHLFGTGHSHLITIEMVVRAGGLANINAIFDDTITTATGARRGSKLESLSGLAEIIWEEYKDGLYDKYSSRIKHM